MADDAQNELNTLKALASISEMAAKAQDLSSLWGPLLDKLLAVLQVDAGTLMILEGNYLIRKAAQGLDPEIMREPPIPSHEGGISWGVVASRKSAVVTDLGKEKIASKTLAEQGFHSLVTVPMMVRDQVIGVMSVFTRKERTFSQNDLNFFSIIANQAALAVISLRSVELIKDNRRRLAELEGLNQISKSISTLFDFEETRFSIVASITKMLRADMGVLMLFDHQDHLLKAASPAYGLTPNQIKDFRTRNDEGVTGEAFCKGIPIMMAKIDEPTQETLKRAKITNAKSILAAPLKVKSQTLGVIQIFSSKDNNFNSGDLSLFSILSSQAAIVVNSSSMYREIEEERKKDEALLTSIGEGVLAIDKEEKIIHLNKAGEKITGFLAEELMAEPFNEKIGLYDKEKQLISGDSSPISQVLENGKAQTSRDYYIRRRNGLFFPVFLSLAAISSADDLITGEIVVFRDITSERELEQMKQELISISTHELRAPITGIKGYLDMILEGDTGGVSGETRATLAEVAKINQQLADLVDDLLNVGRLEQGRITIRPQDFDLAILAEEIVKNYQGLAQDKNITLDYQKDNLAKVKADPERVRQVLNNLVSNALKYTQKGTVTIAIESKDNEIICQVKDSGIGMAKDAQKKLFEKFYRIKNPQTRLINGTGLGLWISKKLLEMMGGNIWFESEEGKGSTFYFSLRAA